MNIKSILLSFVIASLLLSILCCKKNDNNNDDVNNPPITDIDTTMTGEPMDTNMVDSGPDTVRFASFNTSLFRNIEGDLIADMNIPSIAKIQRVAEIIQRVRPDFLALMEFDYDQNGEALQLFQENYLHQSHNGSDTIDYQYSYAVSSNTGVLSEIDLTDDGIAKLPDDAYGFGYFPGQYAFAVLSKFPLDLENIRSFQNMLWTDMPDATLPTKTNGESYYTEDALTAFRLSSKNHIDIPVNLNNGKTINALLSHPTPPVFDGAEDRNGLRNHDEIKLWKDYISNESYLTDDKGQTGGLTDGASFVVMGDLNADPIDGDSAEGAITQLLNHPKINQAVVDGAFAPSSTGGTEHNQNSNHDGDPAFDTSFFGLRTDYVLPSNDLEIIGSGVFWPATNEEFSYLTQNEASSDHLLVWVDFVAQ